ncbi:hypothetical protein FOZ75_10325 [Bifidobacterium longum]|nr:hypothetical protein [Bifidobacterium longum]
MKPRTGTCSSVSFGSGNVHHLSICGNVLSSFIADLCGHAIGIRTRCGSARVFAHFGLRPSPWR